MNHEFGDLAINIGIGQVEFDNKTTTKSPPKKEPAQSGLGKRPGSAPYPPPKETRVYGQG